MSKYSLVVICFQIVLLRYLPQRVPHSYQFAFCCDLLSNCSLMIFTTAATVTTSSNLSLWFAFKLFFDDIYHSTGLPILENAGVVICFQIVLWWYLPQHSISKPVVINCCDLLSNCSLMIFTTAQLIFQNLAGTLWFAFKLFFDDIYHS